MNIIQLVLSIVGSIVSVGILLAGTGYAYAQFTKGKNEKNNEDYKLLTTRVDALQRLCDAQQIDLNNLHQELGKLKGINEEKDKKITELNAILQNRDPALNEFIKYSTESTRYFLDIVPKIVKQLENITENLKK